MIHRLDFRKRELEGESVDPLRARSFPSCTLRRARSSRRVRFAPEPS
ncbi:hypothetical protein MPNT_30115 [Candidatus Methylacidithermus pantelleriae]|uniref:Uncharacterized protein n=1 Tax=Candidatus Methylacidithermus pantelleriae TaxID=2744239 RepID=A0A8J2BMI2_9BACT|nr:hypothetical protein MPNT_30115 [Candidatus Methylacidithermus pantelleriae]